jgi:hypothetical protein
LNNISLPIITLFILSGCQQNFSNPSVSTRPPGNFQQTPSHVVISEPTLTPTESQVPKKSPSPTATVQITPTNISAFTPSPTIEILPPEGSVLVQSSCRYGPGAAYLFEWGLYPGDYVRIINRNEDSSWVFVKPNTFKYECWVKTELLDVRGDLSSLEAYYSPLPQGYLYSSVPYVAASRNGNEVWIQWEPVWMTEDDDRGYLIEAWVCRNGKLVFLPTNYFPYSSTSAFIHDEPGCTEKSHARIYTVEKHGYMPWIPIPWPGFP